MIPRILLPIAILLFTTFACQPNKNNSDSQASSAPSIPKIDLPKTPEGVVIAWEGWFAKNQFEYAKLVSMDNELDYVNTMAKAQAIEPLPASQTEVLNLHCTTQDEQATCNCTVRDTKTGDANWKYTLIRKDGQWLLSDVSASETETANKKKDSKKDLIQ